MQHNRICSIFRSGLDRPNTPKAQRPRPRHRNSTAISQPPVRAGKQQRAASHQLHARPPTSLLDSPSLVSRPVACLSSSASFAPFDAIDAFTTDYLLPLPAPSPPSFDDSHTFIHHQYITTPRLASRTFSRACHCDLLLLRGPQHTDDIAITTLVQLTSALRHRVALSSLRQRASFNHTCRAGSRQHSSLDSPIHWFSAPYLQL